jgi:hypothetical protein
MEELTPKIDPQELLQIKIPSLSEEIEARKALLKTVQLNVKIYQKDSSSADGALILKIEKEIEDLEAKKAEALDKINSDYEELFKEIRGQEKIEGSVKEFSPDEIIKLIEEVRSLNMSLDRKNSNIFLLDRITRTNGLRDKVEALIVRERSL